MQSRASDRASSLATRFLECASNRAQVVGLFFEERTITYGTLAHQSLAFANALRHYRVQWTQNACKSRERAK